MRTMLLFLKKHIILTFLIAMIATVAIIKCLPLLMHGAMPAMPASHVETLVVKTQPGQDSWQAMGTVKAAQDIMLASEASGTVEKIIAPHGSHVEKGAILIQIHHDEVSANLARDRAVLAQKEMFFQRIQKLIAKHAISAESVSEAKSAYQQAKAAVSMDEAQLDKYIIRAPFSGQIGIWQADVGQLVQPGTILVSLTAMTPTYIDFMLPAKDINHVTVGDNIQFTTASYPDRTWQGKVIALDPQLDNATRSVKLRAEVPNTDSKLVPRLFGEVKVIKPTAARLIIPQEAITYNPQGAAVYVLEKKMPTSRQIKVGENIGENVVVISGLKENEEIITAGMQKIFPGMPVVVNKQVVQKTEATATHLASSAP